jgi:hypothetical protein
VANVVLTPEGVIFLIDPAFLLLTKRFPLGSNTIVSGFEIVANVFSVKTTSSVEENSKTMPCRRDPTNKLVVAACPRLDSTAVARQAITHLRWVQPPQPLTRLLRFIAD